MKKTERHSEMAQLVNPSAKDEWNRTCDQLERHGKIRDWLERHHDQVFAMKIAKGKNCVVALRVPRRANPTKDLKFFRDSEEALKYLETLDSDTRYMIACFSFRNMKDQLLCL